MGIENYCYTNSSKGSSFYNLYTTRRRTFAPENVPGLQLWLHAGENVYSDGAVAFDGSNYLSINDNPDIAAGDRDFTWAGWFYYNSLGAPYQTLFSKYGGAQEYLLQVNTSNYQIIIPGVVNTSFGLGTPDSMTWTFVAFRHNSNSDQIIIDIDTAQYSWGCVGGIPTTSEPFKIGAFGAGNSPLAGRVDSFGRWNRFLSDGELALLRAGKIYTDLTTAFRQDLIAWWDFDESTGDRYDSHGVNHLTPVSTLAGTDGHVMGLATSWDVLEQWKSRSDTTKSISQTVFASRPFFVMTGNNGSPEARFDGIDDNLAGSLTLGTEMSMFAVIKQNAWANGNYLFDGTSANNHAIVQSGFSAGILGINRGTPITGCTGLNVGDYGIITAKFASNSGSLQVNNYNPITGNVGNASLADFTIGSRGDGIKFSDINVSEVLVYSGLLNPIYDGQIREYLAKQWSILI